MSSFVFGSSGALIHMRDNESACEGWATNGDLFLAKLWDRIPSDDYFLDAYFESEWWPSRSSLMGGFDGVAENLLLGEAPWRSRPSTRSGCNGRLAFVGYTRDQFGSVLGGCTVRCFRTSSDELVSKVVSDANGYYVATTPYSDGHYLTVHKTLSPDVAGASIDTLVPG